MFKRYSSSQFVRNLSTLASGAAIAQAIPMLLSPYISRVFDADQVALFGLYSSIIGIVSVIASGRYELAIIIPKSRVDAIGLLRLCFYITIVICAMLFGLIVGFQDLIVDYSGSEMIRSWLYFIPFVILIIGWYQSIGYFLLRERKFGKNALNKVSQRVFEGLGIITFGFLSKSSGLIISDIIGRIGALLYSTTQVRDVFKEKGQPLKNYISLAYEFKQYPVKLGLSSLANAASLNLPLFFVANGFGIHATGIFNFMRFVLLAPLSFVAQNLSQVVLERLASKARDKEPVLPDLIKLSRILFLLAVIAMSPIIFFGPIIFEIAFGIEWRESGELAQIMSISFISKFVVSPLSPILNAINRIGIASIWQWLNFLFTISLIPISISGIGIVDFIWVYAIGESILYGIYWLLIYRESKRHDVRITN